MFLFRAKFLLSLLRLKTQRLMGAKAPKLSPTKR